MNISIELNELKKIVIASSMLVCELGYFPKILMIISLILCMVKVKF